MKFLFLSFTLLFLYINPSSNWEYCKSEIKSKLCTDEVGTHIICDSLKAIPKASYQAEHFLAHVPLTRTVRKAFTSWHNYFRNLIAGGKVKNVANSKIFPAASRMRELIWDKELSFISHYRTRLVVMGDDTCHGTQRFPYAGQNIVIFAVFVRQAIKDIKVMNHSIPVLKIISLVLKDWFDEKNKVDNPEEMAKEFKSEFQNVEHFTAIVNDRVSRLGCAIALGSRCLDKNFVLNKLCYYIACTYDYGNSGLIYKTTYADPASECSRWGVGKSETYKNLCGNSGEIFDFTIEK